ncbi:DNA cytosine methyltransferase [Natrinema salsiterrestre]|uniref:DNA (cytosine-5-)-methyltransferase n=1 Tax=Natrinema salsiterrestre TaxID=2950540 RepID=A0A9Q4Q5B1_9EURY|nr:DNA cytosine methyltransferase [Natrinema salsiterrestre]MDF9748397.1 DNA cytosine methyltransferase [Natrinema salsiterrestre]
MLETSQFLGSQQYDEPSEIQQRIGYTDPPTHVSLFSGIGGFDLGFARAGFKNLVAVEQGEHAADTFRRNLIDGDHGDQDEPPVLMERDITKVATWEILEAAGKGIGEITTISGGPPCQGFSHIGKREEDDPRNELYLEMVRIVHQAKPVSFVMENVPGLATMHDGEAIMEVCENFAAGGYHVTWEKVDAADYGVPQHRERVIVIGKRVDVMGMPEEGNPQIHIGAKPGEIKHPEFFRERHDLNEPDQATLDAFGDDPETLDAMLEQIIQEGMAA